MFADALFSGKAVVLTSSVGDLATNALRSCEFGFSQLRSGHFPLWNPTLFSGIPYFAGMEAALLYPATWLCLLLSTASAINWGIALHVFLAGLWTYAWCRRLGVSQAGAFLSAVSFMFSAPFFLHIYAGHHLALRVMAWAPAVFLSLDGFHAERKWRWCLLGMAAVCLQIFAGHPQYVYYTAVAAGLYAVLRRSVPAFAAIYLGGAALAAVQLLPGIAAAGESWRSGGTQRQFAAMFSLPPENFATLLVPHLFGDMRQFPYFGRCYLWETSLYFGVCGLLLALNASFKKEGRVPALMILLMSLLALGRHTPLFGFLYQALPGFNMFRGTSKFIFLAALFLSLLAGMGFDALRRAAAWPKRQALAAALAGALMLALGSWAAHRAETAPATAQWFFLWLEATGESFFQPARFRDPSFAPYALYAAVKPLWGCARILLLASLSLFLMRASRRFVFGLLLIAAGEMAAFAHSTLAVIPLKQEYPAAWSRELEKNPGDYRVLHDRNDFTNAVPAGVNDLWGLCPLILKRYAQFMAATQDRAPESANNYLSFKKMPAILGMLRARYLFINDRKKTIVKLRGELPRLLLVPDFAVMKERDEIFKALLDPKFDPRAKVILESLPEPRPENSKGGKVALVSSSSDDLEITADIPRPAVLLITDSYAQGWRAVPIGPNPQRRYDVMPADYILRAVPLAAGRHHFRLEYAPLSYRIGKWISIISLLVFAALCLTDRTGYSSTI